MDDQLRNQFVLRHPIGSNLTVAAQLLAHDAHRPHGRLPGADQIAYRLVRHIRPPDCGQQPAAVQDCQTGGIRLVVLLPVAPGYGIIEGATTMQSPRLMRVR